MNLCLERLWEYEGFVGVTGRNCGRFCFTRAKYCEQLFIFPMDRATIGLDSFNLSLLSVLLLCLV